MMDNELYHYGIKRRSGRYPWGSGARPHQSLETPKRRSLSITSYVRGRKEKKQRELLEKKRKEILAERKRLAADKDRVIREGSATEVLQYQGQLTNAQMQEIVNRLRLESQLSEYSKKESQASMNKVNDIMNGIKMATDWIVIGTDAYNALVNIYNATEEGKKNPMTKVSKGGGGDGKKK